MTLDEALRAFVLSIPYVQSSGASMAQNIMPEGITKDPYIYYIRESEETPLLLDGTWDVSTTAWSIECVSSDIVLSTNLALEIKKSLHGKMQDMAGYSIRLGNVTSKDDNYIPKVNADEGEHVTALDVSITH